jgi:ankyrin repeat protein
MAARQSSFARQPTAVAAQTQALSSDPQDLQEIAAGSQAKGSSASPRGSQETGEALRHAAEIGDLAGLESLLQKRVDLDSRDSAGRTALMLATLHGQVGTAVALLGHGADPNAADARGTTPLEAARAGDHPDIAAALERYGAR